MLVFARRYCEENAKAGEPSIHRQLSALQQKLRRDIILSRNQRTANKSSEETLAKNLELANMVEVYQSDEAVVQLGIRTVYEMSHDDIMQVRVLKKPYFVKQTVFFINLMKT